MVELTGINTTRCSIRVEFSGSALFRKPQGARRKRDDVAEINDEWWIRFRKKSYPDLGNEVLKAK
jgi:hypothetical protein